MDVTKLNEFVEPLLDAGFKPVPGGYVFAVQRFLGPRRFYLVNEAQKAERRGAGARPLPAHAPPDTTLLSQLSGAVRGGGNFMALLRLVGNWRIRSAGTDNVDFLVRIREHFGSASLRAFLGDTAAQS